MQGIRARINRVNGHNVSGTKLSSTGADLGEFTLPVAEMRLTDTALANLGYKAGITINQGEIVDIEGE